MLDTGERQVAPNVDGIRRDHVARYEFAAQRLAGKVMDLACGVGYGSSILADAGCEVVAVDRSAAALDYARAHYGRECITFREMDLDGVNLDAVEADGAVCFEAIEHLQNPGQLLREIAKCSPILIASVPNEAVFPYRCLNNNYLGYKWHVRHYTRAEFEQLLNENGWVVTEWHGQKGPLSSVEPDVNGRTIIAVCRRGDVVTVKKTPESVAIIGLGQSLGEYIGLVKRLGGRKPVADEVWTINALGDVIACDRIFHMDDVAVQEIRAEAKPDGNIAEMLKWMRTHPGPIYTSVVRDGYPGLVAFPFEEVMNNGGVPYFNSTAAYAVAYAIHIGVKKISMFGCDYSLPNAHSAEKGRGCVEFWLGMAAARGIEIVLPEHTTLMDACVPDDERFYGYDLKTITLRDREDGSCEVILVDRDGAPTADEIEHRYDHNRHPNLIVEKEKAYAKG